MESIFRRLTPQINLDEVVRSKSIFIDSTFPQTVQSLVHSSQMDEYGEFASYTWKRSNQIFNGKKFEVFDGIDINDIEQGDLGDCYFLCSISAVAEFPNRIMELFATREINHS